MTDIALAGDLVGGFDLALAGADLATDDGLMTAMAISLFTDGRAPAGIELPWPDSPRRGWWGDALSVIEGDRTGSLLWLLAREKQTPQLLARVRDYAAAALAWLREDGVAQSVAVSADWLDWVPGDGDRILLAGRAVRSGVVALTVTVTRPDGSRVTRRWDHIWQGMEN